jgi:3-hydroxyacyl-CoA dehydrogenase
VPGGAPVWPPPIARTPMTAPVQYARKGSVGEIVVDNPPVNALSHGVRQGLADAIAQGTQDAQAQTLLIVCKGRTFIAGADIREFGKPLQAPHLSQVLDAIEGCPKPVIAAIHGTALGGGLEVALACHYRCAVPAALFGLPEVKLGLLPGAGGTQRLPRVVGVPAALEMISSGEPIGAEAARAQGLVDEVLTGELEPGALAFAERVGKEKRPLAKIRDRNDKIAEAAAQPNLFADFRKALARRARGNEAPLRCVDAVEAAVRLPFEQGLARERELFVQAMASPQSEALRHVFFAEREVAKVPGVGKETPALPVAQGAVLGSGTMGTGIAMNFANAGIPVTLIDVKPELVEKALATIRANYASTVSKGRLSQAEMDARVARITGATEFERVGQAELVIEAVFEEMALKKEVFGRLDKACKAGAVLASNTSTLDVNEIASATRRPEQVLGMHFFSPANVMRLLEIVRGQKTAPATLATAMAVARQMGKIGVVVGVCDGFVGNRILHQYTREAAFLIEEGALPQQVDKVLYDFGLPMGPFAMGDLAGLDVGWRVRKHRKAQGTLKGRYAGHVADKLCEMGRFGQKTGAGYYKYEKGSRTPIPDPEVEALIASTSQEQGIARRKVSDEEVLARCIYPMINEGAKILEEGIALRPSDIDIIWINGYGFPAYRGGPMHYADSVGVKTVYEGLLAFQKEHGAVWQPAPLLERLAREGKRFADL